VLPARTRAVVRREAWAWPPVFGWLQSRGGIAEEEMLRTFNCGLGMLVVVPEPTVDEAIRTLAGAGETARVVGSIEEDEGATPRVFYA
jgi:phosphoribosylformylglycinamidine cyclo-ligase